MSAPTGDDEIRALYQQLLERWNERDAEGMASLFLEDGHTVGYDGSMLDGRAEIAAIIKQIFSEHETASYVGKVRGITFLNPDVAVLRAVAGMVPRGRSELDPGVNAVQSLVAARGDGEWRIALFQNTPAAFHGRPELSEQLTEDLREAQRASRRTGSPA